MGIGRGEDVSEEIGGGMEFVSKIKILFAFYELRIGNTVTRHINSLNKNAF